MPTFLQLQEVGAGVDPAATIGAEGEVVPEEGLPLLMHHLHRTPLLKPIKPNQTIKKGKIPKSALLA